MKLGYDVMDLMIRNMRLAGRRYVVRLARQLARTENEIERVLQEVEALRDQLSQEPGDGSGGSSRRGRLRIAGILHESPGQAGVGRSAAAAGLHLSDERDGRPERSANPHFRC